MTNSTNSKLFVDDKDESYSVDILILKNHIYSYYRVNRKSDNQYFILKEFYDNDSQFDWETKCYLDLDHPNVMKTFILGRKDRIILFPYKINGDLFMRKYFLSDLDENTSKNIFKKLIHTLLYIHNQKIIHKNIIMSNILLGDNEEPLIIGFSMTGEESNVKAPETILYGKYDEKTDIFNLGVVLFEIITGHIPFQVAKYKDWWYNKIIKKDYELFWKAHESNNKFNEEFKDLINKMLCFEPTDRPNLYEIQRHKWLE